MTNKGPSPVSNGKEELKRLRNGNDGTAEQKGQDDDARSVDQKWAVYVASRIK